MSKSTKTITDFAGKLVTIRSEKSYEEVVAAIESTLQRMTVQKYMEYIVADDKAGQEAYVAKVSAPSDFSIFWDFEQGSSFQLVDIPVKAKFYLVGNAVIARGLFKYTGASGLGAPVRINVSQRQGEQTRIDMDLPSAFFGKFPELAESDVPALLDAKMVKVFEDAAS